MKKLIILSGPSCVGKSPLWRALQRFHPDLANALRQVILYNSRRPRPGEKDGRDYHFRSRRFIKNLYGKENFVVLDVRGDLQALDIEEITANLAKSDLIFEGNPLIGNILLTHPLLRKIRKKSVFISPLSKKELLSFKRERGSYSHDMVTEIMKRKLLKRAERQRLKITRSVLADIKRRAESAHKELREAFKYDFVIPNHDGEDSENWDVSGHPIGDARKTLIAFAGVLKGGHPSLAERWPRNLL